MNETDSAKFQHFLTGGKIRSVGAAGEARGVRKFFTQEDTEVFLGATPRSSLPDPSLT
jgi:hypothetical protein